MKQNDKYLKESIDILNRKFGDPLPTLADAIKAHQLKKEGGKGSGRPTKDGSAKDIEKKAMKAADDANAKMDAAEKEMERKAKEQAMKDMANEEQLDENPAAIAAAVQAMQQMKAANPKTGRVNKMTTALSNKSHPQHKKAKGVFSKIVDKFKKKKKDEPKKQSKADVDFYKKQFTGESVNEGPDDKRDARRVLAKIAKTEQKFRKEMLELEQAFLQDPRTENKKAARDLKKSYKSGVTAYMREAVQMIKRMK